MGLAILKEVLYTVKISEVALSTLSKVIKSDAKGKAYYTMVSCA